MLFLALTDDSSILPWLDGIRRGGDAVRGWWLSAVLDSTAAHVDLEVTSCLPVDAIHQSAINGEAACLIVAGRHPGIFTLARDIGQFGIPILVVTTTAGPTSTLFELMPLWEEQRTMLTAGFSSGLERRVSEYLDALGDAAAASRIEFTRAIAPAGGISTDRVEQHFFQDVHWLTRLAQKVASDPSKAEWELVHTVWTGQQQDKIAQGMVTLSGEQIPETTWTIRSSPTPEWTLTIWRNESSTVLRSSDPGPGLAEDVDFTLHRLKQQLAAKSRQTVSGEDTWSDVLQCGHLLAAVLNSATRQRRVAVHFESGSERSQFKSQMSTFGCGALLWAMFGTIAMLLLAATIDPRDREQRVAEAVNFILDDSDFSPAGGLSTDGERHIDDMASQWSSTTAAVVIAVPFGQLPSDSAFQLRQREVLTALRQHKLEVPSDRLVIRPVVGQWFKSLIILGWAFVFGPLAILLLAQGLIVASHPGRGGS